MAIKVTFKQGQAEAKATPLHQWDYGQVLEIESSDLPAVFEIHFACQGMNEAIVRSCSAVGGIGSVVIPDRCLEQSNQILAWVYAIQGAAGTTIKTITIPIVARTRPSRGDEIPSEISDVYTELVSEVNKAVDDLTNGNVTAANAKTATYATSAGTSVYSGDAERAAKAMTATQADFAARAGVANTVKTAATADKATADSSGNKFENTYGNFSLVFDHTLLSQSEKLPSQGTYQIRAVVKDDSEEFESSCVVFFNGNNTVKNILNIVFDKTYHTTTAYRLFIGTDGRCVVQKGYRSESSGTTSEFSDFGEVLGTSSTVSIWYRKIL